MRKFIVLLVVLISFYNLTAEEENMFGDTSEPITNEDKLEENEGKETNTAPAETKHAKGESKFNKFVNRSGKKALVGIKTGLNISHLWDDNHTGAAGGYFFGAFFEYSFIKNFSLQAELNFSDKGDDTWNLEYFEIPVIAQGVIPVNDMIWLNAGAGLYVAFSYGWWGLGRNTVDGGAIFKAGAEINTKIGVFVADIRYTLGFAKVWNSIDCKNGAFSILVGYAVPLPF